MIRKLLALLTLVVFLSSCSPKNPPTTESPSPVLKSTQVPTPTPAPLEPTLTAEVAGVLGRAVNFGNMLEAPAEGDWGLFVKEEYFDLVKEAGFQTIRFPVRFSAYTGSAPDYKLSPAILTRVDWAVENATRRGLNIIIDVHHFDEMVGLTKNPELKVQLLSIWQQLAEHYQDQPASVYFEICNEPNNIPAPAWNEVLRDALSVIRTTNPDRWVVVGGVDWNSFYTLESLELPASDDHLIATFHYYSPFEFTHQGAEWAAGSNDWLGTKWSGTEEEKAAILRDFSVARAWSEKTGIPVFLGEFGAYSKGDMPSRVAWTQFIARTAESMNFSWAYWELAAGFGIYDPVNSSWRTDLLHALIPE
ncbi:MAG: glycoside hydrolase family 5 protein [Chloroflexi bacterium]|nr:glycoside hydrolase family 5 protein [Chloroflexota bacterium]